MKKLFRRPILVGLFAAVAIAPAVPSLLAPTLASFSAPTWLSSTALAQTANGGVIFQRVNNAWQTRAGQAFDVAIGGNNSIWKIGTNVVPGGYDISRWNGRNWQAVDGGAVGVAVDSKGNPWVINNQGHIFERVNDAWQRRPGRARDIEIGKDGSIWAIGFNEVPGGYGIYRWNGRDWQTVDGGAVRIAVDNNGNPWVVNSNGDIFRRTAGRWQHMPGRAKDIAIGYNNSVWVIGFNSVNGGFGIYRWNGKGWEVVSGGAVRIAVDNSGNPWVVNRGANDFVIGTPQTHSRGTDLATSNGYRLSFQADGNLVMYRPDGRPVWATGTVGQDAHSLNIQSDGNVVLYSRSGTPMWSTNTAGNAGAYLSIQADGNLVVYSRDGKPLFATNTVGGNATIFNASEEWLKPPALSQPANKALLISEQSPAYFNARLSFYGRSGNIFAANGFGSRFVDNGGLTDGNCTWYAHGRVKELGGNIAALNSMSGHAHKWHEQLSNGSRILNRGETPRLGDIAQWDSQHVAVVERVYSQNGTLMLTISESSYPFNRHPSVLHRVRTIRADEPSRFIRVPGT